MFEEAAKSRGDAARLVLGSAENRQWVDKFVEQARLEVFTKGREEHMFKLPAALLEDYQLMHPKCAPYALAAMVHYLPTARHRPGRVQRDARRALSRLKK